MDHLLNFRSRGNGQDQHYCEWNQQSDHPAESQVAGATGKRQQNKLSFSAFGTDPVCDEPLSILLHAAIIRRAGMDNRFLGRSPIDLSDFDIDAMFFPGRASGIFPGTNLGGDAVGFQAGA